MSDDSNPANGSREETFRRLLRDFGAAIQRLANSYEADPALREDLIQEVYLALWQSIPTFRAESSERTWLYRVAHNTAISTILSSNRRRHREQILPAGFESASKVESAERTLIRDEQHSALLHAIRLLPLIDRRIVTLHLDSLSYAEIEQVTGLSQSAIATRLTRARARIAATIGTKENRQ
ncbi:MAG: RNA polymerase sigma factor [Bryobacteraceae bacterium]